MKKALSILVILACVLLIQSLASSIVGLWQKRDVVARAQQALLEEKKVNGELKKQLSKVEDRAFVEEEARNKLFLARPGEKQIILPPISSSSSAKQKETSKPNWQQWLQLFFYKKE